MKKGFTVTVIYPYISDQQWLQDDIDGAIALFHMHVALATLENFPVVTDCILLSHQIGDTGPAEIIKRWTPKDGKQEVAIPYRD